jgi:choice-of-anchor C domain-containing protein
MKTVRLLLLLAVAISLHAAPILTNGSFETDSCSTPGYCTVTNLTGWSVVQGNVDLITGYWPAEQGNNSLDMNGTAMGGIQQSFITLPGYLYQVTFYLAGNPDSPVDKTLQASAAGQAQDYTFVQAGHTEADMGWTEQKFEFVAKSGTTSLQFLSTTAASYWGPALDNVSVEQLGQVPEPSAVLLVAGGLLLLLGRARRR